MENENKKDECQTFIVIVTYWLIVIVAKVIRYTILKETLVDMSIGNGWVGKLTYGMNPFMFSLGESSVASQNSIALFQVFRNFGFNTYVDYEIIITLIWNIIFLSIIITFKKKISIFQIIFLMMSVAVLNIWDFCLAKEPLQMLYFVAIYCILISKKIHEKHKYGLSILVILFSCFTYRNYYILIVAFSIISYFLIGKFLIHKEKITALDLLKIILVFAVTYMAVIIFSKNFYQEAYDSFSYFNQRVTKATTDLSGLFHSENLLIMTVDYILLVIRMLFPLELARFGPQYLLYAIYQIMITIIVIKALMGIKTNNKIKMYAIYLFVGFLFASATFEPDFGSWVRHEAVALPVIILMADLFDNNKEERIEGEKVLYE